MTQIRIALTTKSDAPPPPPPGRPPLWRVKHDLEMGGVWRPKLPEVFPFFPNHYVQFTKYWQLLSFEMNQPWLTKEKWTQVYDYKLWITNHQGFNDGTDPRANYVTGENLREEDPRVEALTCGGNVLTGRMSGDNLIVEMLDWRNPAPTAEWIGERPWFRTVAVTVDGNGIPRRFPQGEQPNGYMPDVVHPLVGDPSRFVIAFPSHLLQPWTAAELPDPYTFYLPTQ